MLKVCLKICSNPILFFRWCHVFLVGSLQLKLRLAAKARIMRMVKAKSKRRDLEVPDWVKTEWSKGNKNQIADLLCSANFDKDQITYQLISDSLQYFSSLTCLTFWFSYIRYILVLTPITFSHLHICFPATSHADSRRSLFEFPSHRGDEEEGNLSGGWGGVVLWGRVARWSWMVTALALQKFHFIWSIYYNISTLQQYLFSNTIFRHGLGPRSTGQRPIVWACQRPMSGSFATHIREKYCSHVLSHSLHELSASDIWRESIHICEWVYCYVVHITSPMQKESLRQRGGVLGSCEGNGKTKGGAELRGNPQASETGHTPQLFWGPSRSNLITIHIQ